jgi:hypothetical protein
MLAYVHKVPASALSVYIGASGVFVVQPSIQQGQPALTRWHKGGSAWEEGRALGGMGEPGLRWRGIQGGYVREVAMG